MKSLIICSLLLINFNTQAQERNNTNYRPATQEEMDVLVSPNAQKSLKESTPTIEASVHDKVIAQALAKKYEKESKYFNQDVEHFFQNKISEGANKNIIIQYANILTSSYMSLVASKIELEDEIKTQIISKQNELTKKLLNQFFHLQALCIMFDRPFNNL